MKKIINILLALTLILVACFSVACGGGVDNGNTEKGLRLKKYSGEDFYTVYGYVDEGDNLETLDIATKAGDKVVGRIAQNAFNGNDTLKEIIVPNTVTEIAGGAFAKMKKLEKVTLPFVGKTAVADSFLFETDEATNKSVDIERNFAYIFGTEEYSFGEAISVSYGSGSATYYIPSSLQEVTIAPASEYKIPMYAFSGVKLISKINLNGNITVIGENAFENCRDLSSINIPSTVTDIYKKAFNGCEYLNEGLTFDANSKLVSIGSEAFVGSGVKQLTLPATVKTIGDRAFKNCGIQKIVLSASLESIGAYAFYGCGYLTTVDVTSLPVGQATLGVWAFEDCAKLDANAIQGVWKIA